MSSFNKLFIVIFSFLLLYSTIYGTFMVVISPDKLELGVLIGVGVILGGSIAGLLTCAHPSKGNAHPKRESPPPSETTTSI